MGNQIRQEGMPGKAVRRGCSTSPDAAGAVRELFGQLGGDINALLFFCSPHFDLQALGRSIHTTFSCPAVGCTTAGEICSPHGYLENSLVGVGFASPDISMTPAFIPSLKKFVNGEDKTTQAAISSLGSLKQFGFLLIDGLSLLEERVTSILQRHLGDSFLIGGSAGDGLDFRETFVYHEGDFHSDAAVLALFSTSLPFRTFRVQHLVPTETRLVITEADVDKRTVGEINGLPATQEYARIVGVDESELSPEVFARHPLMLRIGGEYFVRSIRRANNDSSLSFYCAITNGLVLTLARGENLLHNLEKQLHRLTLEAGAPQLVLGCDCILRRLEVEVKDEASQFKEILAKYPFAGLNTYGEQYGGIHVNQTLTGLFLGGKE
ncbi:MAG: FIST N-terminal domain-containing protein [Desulfonatronovibrionaceae bacterium]